MPECGVAAVLCGPRSERGQCERQEAWRGGEGRVSNSEKISQQKGWSERVMYGTGFEETGRGIPCPPKQRKGNEGGYGYIYVFR